MLNKYLKAIEILKNKGICVIPTDTIYGILGLALDEKVVEKIYKIRKRKPNKPMIILISSVEDLKKFNLNLDFEK